MKLKLSSIIVAGTMALILSSCAEQQKTQVCQLDKIMLNGDLNIQYVYTGDQLTRCDLYDSTGYAGKYVWTYNGSGAITNVDVYVGAGDTLSHSNVVFINGSGKVDSVQTYTDSNADNVADFFYVTHIYHYTGDKITTIDRRFDGGTSSLYATWDYTGNNISTITYATSGNYYVYTHSTVKDPYYAYMFTENLVSEPAPSVMSEYLPTNRKRYDSLDVLQTNVDYVPSEIANGVQMYYPANGITLQFLLSCIEQ